VRALAVTSFHDRRTGTMPLHSAMSESLYGFFFGSLDIQTGRRSNERVYSTLTKFAPKFQVSKG